jgi:hypothetical protein
MTLDERLEALTHSAELHEHTITAHDRAIADHEQWLATHDRAKADHEQWRTTHEKALADHEQWLAAHDRAVAAHQKDIAALDQQLRRAIRLNVQEVRAERKRRAAAIAIIDEKITQLAAAQLITEEKLQRYLQNRGGGNGHGQ